MKKCFLIFFSVSAFFLLCHSCSENKRTEKVSVNPFFQIPKGWPKPVYNFENNPLTEERIILGKILFNDKILSVDNSISCGSCHIGEKAFSDAGKPFSKGVKNSSSLRNTPPLFNLAWNASFMWDGGVNHIEVQPLAPITNVLEMGEKLENVITKINASTDYKKLFKDAFQTDSITSQLIFRALAQFTGTLVSANSKYDKVMRGEKNVIFDSEEERGYKLFKQNCSTCHTEPLFTNGNFERNQMSLNENAPDQGRFLITRLPEDSAKFKVPTLRNLNYTYPYVHDGRFWTRLAILEHYSGRILKSSSSHELRIARFSKDDKKYLLAFLETLNDPDFIEKNKN